jgi:hypothetical protein
VSSLSIKNIQNAAPIDAPVMQAIFMAYLNSDVVKLGRTSEVKMNGVDNTKTPRALLQRRRDDPDSASAFAWLSLRFTK